MYTFSKFFSTSVVMALMAQDCTKTDTVQNGDTCDSICVRKNVPYHQLRVYNPWINDACNNLHQGNFLCLAKQGGDCGDDHTHIVQQGESCWSISQAYHINMQTFLTNNGLTTTTCRALRVGEVVCVNGDVIPYPDGLEMLD